MLFLLFSCFLLHFQEENRMRTAYAVSETILFICGSNLEIRVLLHVLTA